MLDEELETTLENQEAVETADTMLYFDEDKATDHKVKESKRMMDTWHTVLNQDPRIFHSLREIDGILTENDHEMPAHISSPDYPEVSLGQKTSPDNLRLRISQPPEELSSIDNHFFQQMTETGTEYQVEGAPISFEIGPLYDELICLDTNTEYLQVCAPTLQDFYDKEFMRGVDHYREQDEDQDVDLGDIFNSSYSDSF